jgi:hypothetical protein
LSPHDVLKETESLILHLNVTSRLTSDHYTNYINLEGRLPEDKPRLLDILAAARNRDETEFRPIYVGTS